jgi:hypothetical protein
MSADRPEPCPFCGKQLVKCEGYRKGWEAWTCPGNCVGSMIQASIGAWNTRTNTLDTSAAVEKMAEIVKRLCNQKVVWGSSYWQEEMARVRAILASHTPPAKPAPSIEEAVELIRGKAIIHSQMLNHPNFTDSVTNILRGLTPAPQESDTEADGVVFCGRCGQRRQP